MDSGVFAPVLTFKKLFEAEGVPVTDDEVRGPMGVHKRVGEVIAADTYMGIGGGWELSDFPPLESTSYCQSKHW